MNVTILLFAGLAELFGDSRVTVELPHAATVNDLLLQLTRVYPEHAEPLSHCFVAVNQCYALGQDVLSETDEIALIPPVSGGDIAEDRYCITKEVLHAQEVLDKVLHPNHGASLVFVGTTREWTGDTRTIQLEYDAYIPMALKTMREIGDELSARWHGACCAISHRIGTVAIGEASVIIAVSAPHRDICYDASRYAIDRLKQVVPIWKKELGENGAAWKGSDRNEWNPTNVE